ncbi:MAG: amidohydrolase family protein, partial [Clostridia bacterium]|nr:amidohydrolase family protein [Clostridia bacterium]
ESEYMQIARDVELLKETGAKYHVCHVSTKESVDIIRNAKKCGVDITCETAPHYLVLNDGMLKDEGRFKMNPPIRSEEDRLALIEGIKDGTIDMIATDHAPHSEEEKSKGLKGSLMGIVGLETCFPVLYTHLVKTNEITLNKLIELLSVNPRKRFGVTDNQGFTVWNLEKSYNINSNEFLTKGRSTPFENDKVFGRCLLTVYEDKIVYIE